MNFEEIESIEDLEAVSEESVWQNFERLAGFIFEKNDFRVRVNTVKTQNKKRRQYDVIAWKGDQTFLVECKKWAGNRYRLSALKSAILKHKERTAFYESITNEKAVPVIVALIEEEILIFEGVPIVPVTKLDAFIKEFDNHTEGTSYTVFEDKMTLSDEWEPESGDDPEPEEWENSIKDS
jgi:protease II